MKKRFTYIISIYEVDMEQVVVSSDYRIEIPDSLRSEMHIKPGQSVFLVNENGIIKIITKNKLLNLFGIAKDVGPSFIRDEKDLPSVIYMPKLN